MSAKRIIAIVLIAGLATWSCGGPTPPEPAELGPAAVISIDSVTTGPGTVEVPLRMSYLPGGKERMDALLEFFFVLTYDPRALTLQDSVAIGEAISSWKYFNFGDFSLGREADSVRGIHFKGLRVNQVNDPDTTQGRPEGIIARLLFTVAADDSLSGRTAPLGFSNRDCLYSTLRSQTNPSLYYMADGRLGQSSADAEVDTVRCPRSQQFEPILQFENGAVQIEEFEYSSTAAIIGVEPVRALFGSEFDVPISIHYPKYMIDPQVGFSGYDLLIEYDTVGIDLVDASRGTATDAWEYFTWRAVPRLCDSCHTKLVRLVSIWDMNNGVSQEWSTRFLEGPIAMLHFRADANAALINTVNTIKFQTFECGDNVFASYDGNTLYLADPDDPESDRGAISPDECTASVKPDHFVEERLRFRSGSVTIGVP